MLMVAVFLAVLAVMGAISLLIEAVFPAMLFVVAPALVSSIFLVTGLSSDRS